MSKSRRPPSRSRKATPRRRAPKRRSAPADGGPKVVRLKPLYESIGRTIDQLQKLPPSDRVKFAIDRLAECRAEFANICGPTMDIPATGLPVA